MKRIDEYALLAKKIDNVLMPLLIKTQKERFIKGEALELSQKDASEMFFAYLLGTETEKIIERFMSIEGVSQLNAMRTLESTIRKYKEEWL